MEQNTSLNGSGLNLSLIELEEILGEEHIGTSYETPLRDDAFDLSDDKKKRQRL